MTTLIHSKLLGYLMIIVGLFLCALPLYAELLTKQVTVPAHGEGHTGGPYNSMDSIFAFKSSSVYSVSMMDVPPWLPLTGGCFALAGGLLIGRKKSLNTSDH